VVGHGTRGADQASNSVDFGEKKPNEIKARFGVEEPAA
jgi:hypothetical protein